MVVGPREKGRFRECLRSVPCLNAENARRTKHAVQNPLCVHTRSSGVEGAFPQSVPGPLPSLVGLSDTLAASGAPQRCPIPSRRSAILKSLAFARFTPLFAPCSI